MASLSWEKRGGKRQARIWFEVNAERKSIRLGEISKRNAENVLSHLRELETCKKLADSPQSRTVEWLGKIDDSIHEKLSKSALVESRVRKTIGEFFQTRVDEPTIKLNTKQNRVNVRKKIIEVFGADTMLHQVTKEQAEKFHSDLLARFSGPHAHKMGKRARQVFGKAVKLGLLHDNPFSVLRLGSESNPERQVFVSHADIEAVIDYATTTEFKLIIALARYGGLRIPSEIVPLKWGHVNWEKSRIEITDTKRTAPRLIPIFAELKPYLDTMWDEAPKGAEFVIPSYRSPNANLRTRLEKTIKRAGLTPWPKLWQNLRCSRETELADRFPIQVVTAWIGNSVKVAEKHYLQVTDVHFAAAIQGGAEGGADGANMVQSARGAECTSIDKHKP